MPHAGHRGAVVDIGIWRSLDDQEAGEPSLHTRQRMIHDRGVPCQANPQGEQFCTDSA